MVKEVEESIASGTARPLNIPYSLPNLPCSVVVSIDGKGCKKRRSITHKCSNHKDCPYSKHHQHKPILQNSTADISSELGTTISTTHTADKSSLLWSPCGDYQRFHSTRQVPSPSRSGFFCTPLWHDCLLQNRPGP